jgi:hypothetical protein
MFKHRQRRVSPPTADASSRLFHGQDREHLGVDVSNRLSGQAWQWEISKRTMMFCSIQTYSNLWWNMGFPNHMWTMWCGSIWCFIQTLLVCDCSDWSSLDRVCNMKLFQFHQFDGHVQACAVHFPWTFAWPGMPRWCGLITATGHSDRGESEALSQLWKPQMWSHGSSLVMQRFEDFEDVRTIIRPRTTVSS